LAAGPGCGACLSRRCDPEWTAVRPPRGVERRRGVHARPRTRLRGIRGRSPGLHRPSQLEPRRFGHPGFPRTLPRRGGSRQPRMAERIVFSDLDGTLLDARTYDWRPAERALARLAELGVPVILTSSKTRAEIEEWRRTLGNREVFVSENGGGIYF